MGTSKFLDGVLDCLVDGLWIVDMTAQNNQNVGCELRNRVGKSSNVSTETQNARMSSNQKLVTVTDTLYAPF